MIKRPQMIKYSNHGMNTVASECFDLLEITDSAKYLDIIEEKIQKMGQYEHKNFIKLIFLFYIAIPRNLKYHRSPLFQTPKALLSQRQYDLFV